MVVQPWLSRLYFTDEGVGFLPYRYLSNGLGFKGDVGRQETGDEKKL